MAGFAMEAGVPVIDWSPLANLPNVIQRAQNTQTLRDLGQGLANGSIDYRQAAAMAARTGDLPTTMSLLKLGQQQQASKNFESLFQPLIGGNAAPARRTPAAPKPGPSNALPEGMFNPAPMSESPSPLSGGTPSPSLAAADLPRGLRNNNPLNLEASTFTQSQPGYVGSDGRFGQFASEGAGMHAADDLLANYGKQGVNTIAGVVSKWAPSADGNNVAAYANFVGMKSGINPNSPINLADPATRSKILAAMAQFENGRPVSMNAAPASQSDVSPVAAAPLAFNGQPQNANPLANLSALAFRRPIGAAPAPAQSAPGNTFVPQSGPQPNVTMVPTRPAALAQAAPAAVPAVAPAPPAVAAAAPGINPGIGRLLAVISNPDLPAAQRQIGLALLQRAMPSYQFQAMPDGTIVRIDKNTGQATPIYRGRGKLQYGNIGTDVWGQPIHGYIDTQSMKIYDQNGRPVQNPAALAQSGGVQGGGAGNAAPGTATGGNRAFLPGTGPGGLHGDAFLKSDVPPELRDIVRKMANYEVDPRTLSYRGGLRTRVIAWASQYDPNYDAAQYPARAAAIKEFNSGGPNSPAGTITAGNTALQHLGHLWDLSQEVGGVNHAGPLNSTFNWLHQGYESANQDPAYKAYNAGLSKFVEEATKFYRGTGGNEADLQRDIQNLSVANSPAAREAAMRTLAEFMKSKINALQDRWKTAMGPTGWMRAVGQAPQDFNIIQNESQKQYDKILGVQPNAAAAPGSGTRPGASDALAQARDAIARGADRNAVIQRLQQMGINPAGL